MSRIARVIGLVLALSIVVTNAFFVAFDLESWPFTSAPMFSHEVHPQSVRGRFQLRAPTGRIIALKGRMGYRFIWRSFWRYRWRDPATRAERVEEFLAMVAAKQPNPDAGVELWLERVANEDGADRRVDARRIAVWSPDGIELTP